MTRSVDTCFSALPVADGQHTDTIVVRSPVVPSDTPIVPRERLFDLLDVSSSRSILWISAPPGSGKTTLASSYLAARGRAHIRIALDAHDADPASFFHTLRSRLTTDYPSLATILPTCLPDDVRDPLVYARQFFRRLVESIDGPWVLVLDDCQEIGEATPLHAALASIAEELPQEIQLWILSRDEPAPAFARVRAAGQLCSIDALELRFSLAESQLLCADSDADAQHVHALANGWAAGLVLLLEGGRLERRIEAWQGTRDPMPEQWFFDYFASEVFDRLAANERQILLKVAALPFVTATMADAMASPDAGAVVLERLHRRNLFVERRPDAEPVYVLHDLFRTFLQRRAFELLPATEWLALRRRSTELLVAHGEHDLAFDALLALDDRDAASELVLHAAAAYLDTGRLLSVARWIEALGETLDERPMLRYWRAACRLHENPVDAAEDFAFAYAHLLRDGSTVDAMLAIAGYCEATVVSGHKLATLDQWIIRFETQAEACLADVDAATELRILPGLLAALVARQPQHQLLDPLVERAEIILERNPGARQRILFSTVASCYIDQGHHEQMSRLVERVESTGDPRAVPPSLRLRWLHATLFWKTLTGRLDEAGEDAVAAMALCEEHGLRGLRAMTTIMSAQARWTAGEPGAARDELCRARALVAPLNLVERSVIEFLEGVVALQQGQFEAAVAALRQAVVLACEAGSPGRERVARFELALALTENGDFAAANAELSNARQHPSFARSPFHQWVIAMIEANLADRSGDSVRLVKALTHGASIARLHGYRYAPGLYATGIMPRLCARALRLGIDVPLVEEWIRTGRLRPPDGACESWPWPLRLQLFGNLAIERAGVPLPRGRKTSRKPLDLLAHLVAAGGEASADHLVADLWPDMEPVQARAVFDNTLHRLRHLLDVDGAIVARGAGIAIDETIVSVDVLAFRRLLERVRRTLVAAADAATLEALASELLSVGETPFLVGDDRCPTLVATRERLALARSRSLLRIAERLADGTPPGVAIELLERIVEQDPLAENACRLLIRLHAENGTNDEAAVVYRRLRQALARSSRSMPSSDTVREATRAGALDRPMSAT